jgi:hypothetical protein
VTPESARWVQFTNLSPSSLAQLWSIVPCAHNTSDCRKYDKDSKLKKSFRKGQHGSTASIKSLPVYLRIFRQRLQSSRRWMRSSRRACTSASTVRVVIVMTPTPLEGKGPVAHAGHSCQKSKVICNTQLDKKTTPCPSKATNTSILNVTLNLLNTDAKCDQNLKKAYR